MTPFKNLFFSILTLCSILFSCKNAEKKTEPSESDIKITLKDAFEDHFLFGTALNTRQIQAKDKQTMNLVKQHFNSIVAENVMKSVRIQPSEGEFNFDIADRFVDFGVENEMHIHGHTLIWHSQVPKWFFKDRAGNTVSKEVLTKRMETHITTVVGRYKGRIHSWDVVNEAIEDDGSYRESKFYEILGEDFIKLAFEFAHDADPEAELYYNDYSMSNPAKRKGVLKMVEKLKHDGVPIHGIGMQGHIGLNHPNIVEFEKSLEAYGKLGKVMITELDLSVLPSPWGDAGAEISDTYDYDDEMNPFSDALPEDVEQQFTKRYLEFFDLFLKHQDDISRVALWGVNDGNSWKNNWPVSGRTDYPLLFNRENKAKPIVKELIELASRSKPQ